MDVIIDVVVELAIEFLGELIGGNLISIYNPKKRRWALTIFYAVLGLGFAAVPAYFAIRLGVENNTTGAIVLGVFAAVEVLVFGFLVIRGHRQNWKGH